MTEKFEAALLDAYKGRGIRKYSVVRAFARLEVQRTYTLYVAYVSKTHQVTTSDNMDTENSPDYSIQRVLDLIVRDDPDWVMNGSTACYPFGDVTDAASMRFGKKGDTFQALCIPSERLRMFSVQACALLLRKFDVAAITPDNNGNIIEIPLNHRFPAAVMETISPATEQMKDGTLYSFAMFKRALPAS